MFFTKRFFVALAALFVLCLLGYVYPVCLQVAKMLTFLMVWLLLFFDIPGTILLKGLSTPRWSRLKTLLTIVFVGVTGPIVYYVAKINWIIGLCMVVVFIFFYYVLMSPREQRIRAYRTCSDRFSNGDENEVRITVEDHSSYSAHVDVIDELPPIFQRRDILFTLTLKPRERRDIVYHLRPVRRGVYNFGRIRLFVTLPLGLVTIRLTDGQLQDVKVYPSYLMLNRYEFLAAHHNLTEFGIKRIRRLGHHTEFEHIKEYVRGDDYRTVNWKASARRHQIMVNTYQDERSQLIYNVIDKGRIMQSAFRGMTLLDYAINASLVLSYVAIHRDDKAGLTTFAHRVDTFLPASRRHSQMQLMLESLYRQATDFDESDYSALAVHLNRHVTKRSLLILYTNFDAVIGIDRQLDALRTLARRHVVLVVFFENASLTAFAARSPRTLSDYFDQTLADKFITEKQHIVSHLRRHGIHSLLTTPEHLSVDVINRYLEMKSRHII